MSWLAGKDLSRHNDSRIVESLYTSMRDVLNNDALLSYIDDLEIREFAVEEALSDFKDWS